MHPDCLFCKIIEGKIPSQKVFENEKVFAFRDIHPQAAQHILVIPKFHVSGLSDLKDVSIMSDIYDAALKIVEQLGIKQTGFRTIINTGQDGGQTVFHLHLHILGGSQLSGKFG